MNKKERINLIRELEAELAYGRFIHTLDVASTAAALAMCYGADMDKAEAEDGEDDERDEGRTATVPFMNRLFGGPNAPGAGSVPGQEQGGADGAGAAGSSKPKSKGLGSPHPQVPT